MKDKFYIGYHGYFYNPSNWNAIFPEYSELNINFMHNYGFHAEYGDSYDGGFTDAIGYYSSNVGNLLSNWNATFPGSNALFLEREKILRPAYGQLSDYQCENVPAATHPRYGYANRNGNDYSETWQDENVSGIYTGLPDGSNPAHWLISGLYENMEQINFPKSFDNVQQYWDIKYHYSDIKVKGYKWFVLPRMRIDSAAAYGISTPVVYIVGVNYEGDTVLRQTINTDNFKDVNGIYNGQYREIYYDQITGQLLNFSIRGDSLNRGNTPISDFDGKSSDPYGSKVDYRVYWYGQVNVHLDRVRVADEWGYYLFYPDPTHIYDFIPKIQEECTNGNIGGNSNFGYFYMDEHMYNSFPCMARVDSIIKSYKSNSGLVPEINTQLIALYSGTRDTLTPDEVFDRLVSRKAVNDVLFMYVYPFTFKETSDNNYSYFPLPPNVTLPNKHIFPGTNDYYKSSTNQNYNDTINYWFEHDFYSGFGHNLCLIDQFRRAATLQKNHPNIMFCAGTQSHSYEDPIAFNPTLPAGCLREPTNEEIRVQDYLAMAYGARIILNYSFYSYKTWNDTALKNWGMQDIDGINKRDYNYYGERKFDSCSALNSNLVKIGKIMYKDNNLTWDDSRTVDKDGLPFKYVNGVRSSYQVGYPNGPVYQDTIKYWEIGFFNTSASNTKYFMMVNKRCVPGDDIRMLGIMFDSTQLTGFRNWRITDVLTGNDTTFDKDNQGTEGYVSLGSKIKWFNPGEGKLFKLEPAILKGGTLIADEILNGISITCSDTIISSGHNITVTGNSTIGFSDSAVIIMNGGTFQTGSASNGPGTQYNTFQGTGGHKWNGLQFSGTNVKIYNAKFQDINGAVLGGNYAVTCINCPLNDIRYSNFIMGNDTAGGVNIAFTNSSDNAVYSYIKYNTFSMNGSFGRAIQIQGFAGNSAGTYIETNSLSSDGNAIGMFLSTVSSGSVRNNTLSNFIIGINASLSTLDLFGNTISNSTSVSDGIKAVSSSNINLSPNGGEYTGGFNNITSSSGISNDIEVNKSIFNIDRGSNTFDVLSSGYHLYGTFYNTSYTTQATHNCFKIGGTNITDTSLPNNYVTNSKGNVISFTFSPYNCTPALPSGQTIVDIGNGMYDTIPTLPGIGGSYSSAPAAKQLYDSLHTLMIFRNYSSVKNLCYALINTFPDSTESSEALQTLYMASVSADTSQSAVNTLKSFYEGLILNHPDNIAMVTISNYLVLKCKVLLRQYSQALAGFQQIINNNPYSYDGLLARWDYMATSLLMNGGNGGGEISNLEFVSSDLINKPDESDDFGNDKSPFSKQQRTAIRQSVITTLDDTKKTEEQKIDILTQKAKNGDVAAQKELKQKINLKSVIKTERPKNIFEHLKIVNADIQKVFGTKENYSSKNQNNIPTVFNLYQNYPNPFNPTATIKYDLPKDVKVLIKIYDILGREVKQLVDEFKKAGSYTIDFNGTNLASGVYFYRIEAGDFVQSKKMVLVK